MWTRVQTEWLMDLPVMTAMQLSIFYNSYKYTDNATLPIISIICLFRSGSLGLWSVWRSIYLEFWYMPKYVNMNEPDFHEMSSV